MHIIIFVILQKCPEEKTAVPYPLSIFSRLQVLRQAPDQRFTTIPAPATTRVHRPFVDQPLGPLQSWPQRYQTLCRITW